MSKFEELLAGLQALSDEQSDTLAKAIPEEGDDDAEIEDAAAEAGVDGDDVDSDGDKDDDELMTKSVMIDGQPVDVVDAVALIKSVSMMGARLSEQESLLAKALEHTLEITKNQGALIKSLEAKVQKLAGTGAGRKSVLSIQEKPQVGEHLAKSNAAEGVTHEEFMAKSNAAFDAKKISGMELNTISVSLRGGHPIDQTLINKVLS